jgi:hypothetical protein
MNKSLSVISIFLLSMYANKGFSQTGNDTILLLNGTTVITTIVDTSNGVTQIRDPKNPNNKIMIENDRIFSINNSKGETILYGFDSIIGNEFTVDEMRYFIKGEQDAQKGFKARGAFLGNLAVGGSAGVTGLFLAPVAPFAFTALVGLPKVKIKKGTVSNPEYLNHDSYLMGYSRVASKKRKLQSLIGGGIGLVVGLGTSFVLRANDAELIK